MFQTKALSSLKGMLPPIHQPLPLNQRESQQLLNALTTSFRRQLDKEHGWLHDDTLTTTTKLSSPNTSGRRSSSPLRSSAASSKDAHRRPTDRHLRAILSNPLFSYDRSVQQEARVTGAVTASIERDPMDVFDEAVAKGLMTPRRAAGCLQAKKREIVQSATPSVRDSMAASGAGLRVVQWLRASGMERDLAFLDNTVLTNLLLRFMVAEGLEDVAWGWIDRCMRDDALAAASAATSPVSRLVGNLLRVKSLDVGNLNEAYVSIVRGEDMFRASPHFETAFTGPWRQLAWASTVEAWKRSNPSPSLFESFVSVGRGLHTPLRIDRAHLDLHHPTRPSHALAIKILQNESLWERLGVERTRAENQPASTPFAIRCVSMGLDTVRHLTQLGQTEEAQWVLDLLRGHFKSPEFARTSAMG